MFMHILLKTENTWREKVILHFLKLKRFVCACEYLLSCKNYEPKMPWKCSFSIQTISLSLALLAASYIQQNANQYFLRTLPEYKIVTRQFVLRVSRRIHTRNEIKMGEIKFAMKSSQSSEEGKPRRPMFIVTHSPHIRKVLT